MTHAADRTSTGPVKAAGPTRETAEPVADPVPGAGHAGSTDDLSAVADARRRSVAASRSPLWVDLVASLMVGAAAALVLRRTGVSIAVGIALFAGGCALSLATSRRRGSITDDRAIGASMLIYAATLAPLTLLFMWVPRDAAWWMLTLVGVVTAIAAFVYVRVLTSYQDRRLTRGDFGPYDIS